MLVLTRKKNESVLIGDDIVVTVLEINGNRIRLGITAPRETPIARDEVYEVIHSDEVDDDSSSPANRC